jgi:hypothetical protein
MAQRLNRVERGDIITADMWNVIVDAVNELLESSQTSGIKITALMPAGTNSEPLRIGTLVQIVGQSFGYSVGQASVSFEGGFGSVNVPYPQLLLGSSDTRLTFLMPPIPGLTQTGTTVSMRVSNGVADDVRSVFVMPIVVSLQGDMFVNWRATVPIGAVSNPNPNPLQTGQAATFAYQLQSATNLPATYMLSADILNASVPVPSNLVDSIRFLDQSPIAGGNFGPGSDIPNKSVQLGKGETRNIYIRIPSLPAGFANATFTLRVTASSTGTVGNVTGSDARTFTVGTIVTPPDPNIELQETGHLVLNSTTGDIDDSLGQLVGSTIQLKRGGQMVIQLNAHYKQSGTYDITPPDLTQTGWTLVLLQTPTSQVINSNDETHLLQFGVTAGQNAIANSSMVLRIKRQGASSDQTKEYTLQLLP